MRRSLTWTLTVGLLTFLVIYVGWISRTSSATRLTPGAALLEAPLMWWLFSSVAAFLVLMILYLPARGLLLLRRLTSGSPKPLAAAGISKSGGKPVAATGVLLSPSRRVFLERAASVAGAVPFAAGAYGLLIERVDLEITHQRILLPRLPRAFDGFRIAQLSDIHIGPFMTGAQIRKWAEVANQLKPDLMVLTGDYVTWDAATQGAVVASLSVLKAPFGVFGSLGNHDAWAGVEASITQLFAEVGFKILRSASKPIGLGVDTLNLIGVDFQSRRPAGKHHAGIVDHYLAGIEPLVRRDTVNILLSHNPNTFDRAAELGIDLSLAGHTHGGQVTLEFISPKLSPSRLITSYMRGHYRKLDSQLYVNRGIGTIAVPIRIDAPPEITLFELRKA